MKFNKLTPIKVIGKSHNYEKIWECLCDCGNITKARTSDLTGGHKKSCGCQKIISATKHNMCRTIFYRKWNSMKNRCLNKDIKRYKDYGGRGIDVDINWYDFENFKKDMYADYLKFVKKNGSKNTTIERIDNNNGYSKNNCKWATFSEQSHNKRSNRILEYNGKKLNITQWAKELNIKRETLYARLYRSWSTERILNLCQKKLS